MEPGGRRVFQKFFRGWILVPVIICVAALTAIIVRADAPSLAASDIENLKEQIRIELSHQYPGARIDLTGPIKLVHGTLAAPIRSVTWTGEPIRGEAHLSVNGSADVSAVYIAYVPARVSKVRISPNQKLLPEMFALQDVNVTTGMAYEMRGLILSQQEDVTRLETRQTIMEGQFLMSSAVEKIPDIRKGDSVRIHIISGDLNLSASGFAAEPGYEKNPIKVIVSRSKRELTGELEADGVVEVKLQ
jgi:flagella basal body P-ring formation protein FlgA